MSVLLRQWLWLCIALAASLTSIPYAAAGPFENYSKVGGGTERSPNRKKGKGCSNYYLCGPVSIIELTMLTSGGHSANYDVGENSTLEQMMKSGEDLQNTGILSLADTIAEKKAEHEAQKITIKIPLIDYGYSGTFTNIQIKVAENGESFQTAKIDEYTGAVSGFTGSLTIEEYTPYNMKGSYSGTLHSYVETNAPYRGPSPDQQVEQYKLVGNGSVTGSFNILSPWEDDERMNDNIDYQSGFVEPMQNDIKRLAEQYDIDVDVDELFEQVNANNSQPSQNTSTTASVYGDCNCSCNFTQTASTTCKAICDDSFKICGGERYSLPTRNRSAGDQLPSMVTENSKNIALGKDQKLANLDHETIDRFEKGEVATPSNLRDKFVALLEQKQPGKDKAPMRKMMLQGFDSMPDDKSKMVMFIGIGGKE